MQLHYLFLWAMLPVKKFLKRRSTLILIAGCILIIFYKWKFTCTNKESLLHVNAVCTSYLNGASTGNLCGQLCQPDIVPSLTCHNYYEKSTVFSVPWNNTNIVFKSAEKLGQIDQEYSYKVIESEDDYFRLIKSMISLKFNMIVSDIDARKILYLYSDARKIKVSGKDIKALVSSNEYLALILYDHLDTFPKLVGTCGTLYAVKKLNTISGYAHLMTLYDSRDEWIKRIKIAIRMLEFVMRLENGVTEPLLICNIKMNHFGMTNDLKKIMYLDLDSVYPVSVVNKITGDRSVCTTHGDCDFLNCRSFCNLISKKCQHGVVNNNLQIVCERIFLGWVMSGRVMIPGLLMGPHTPHVLVELLEECANPAHEIGTPRAMATKEVRKRLYDLLVHMAY